MQKKIVIKTFFCQERCQIAVLKAISKVKGVDEVAIDAEKNTVTLIGDIDVTKVVKNLAKVGKMADILSIAPYKKEAPKPKPESEPKPKPKQEPKPEPKQEPKPEPKQEPKPEAKKAEKPNPNFKIEIINPHCNNGYCGGSCNNCCLVRYGGGYQPYLGHGGNYCGGGYQPYQGQGGNYCGGGYQPYQGQGGNYCGGGYQDQQGGSCSNGCMVYEEDTANCIIM